MERFRYPYLPLFPRVRGVFLLDEERNIFHSTIKTGERGKLIPGLLHATTGVSQYIGGGAVYNITTGKLRIYLVEEEKPFSFFTAVVVNREASRQVKAWSVYLSKLMGETFLANGLESFTKEVKEIAQKCISKEMKLNSIPNRKKVMSFASQVYDLVTEKGNFEDQMDTLDEESQKEEKKYESFLSNSSIPEGASIQEIVSLIRQGKFPQAYLAAKEKEGTNQLSNLLQILVGILLKTSYPEVPAPPLDKLEEANEAIRKQAPHFTRLFKFAIKKLKSVQEGLKVYDFLKKGIGEVVSKISPPENDQKKFITVLLLHVLNDLFFPTEKEVLSFLSRIDGSDGKTVSPWWEADRKRDNLYHPLLPYLPTVDLQWQEIQPFFHRFVKEQEEPKNLRYNPFALPFLVLAVIRSSTLSFSDKKKLLRKFRSQLEKILEAKSKSIPAKGVPLAHLGMAAIHGFHFIFGEEATEKEKWKKHGQKAIKEALKLNKRNRMGGLLTLVILLMALDVLHLTSNLETAISSEVFLALKRLTHQEEDTIKTLEEITSPFYVRQKLLLVGLILLLKTKEYKGEEALIRRGKKMLQKLIHKSPMRGAFTWDSLANLFHIEASLPKNFTTDYTKKIILTIMRFLKEKRGDFDLPLWMIIAILKPLEDLPRRIMRKMDEKRSKKIKEFYARVLREAENDGQLATKKLQEQLTEIQKLQ